MQEMVGYLIKYPNVLREVMEGNACLLGVDKDQSECIIKGFKGLEIYSMMDWHY
ncbi:MULTISPECIES: competence pheromone ComX [Bacillus]|uniref:Pheromone n=1 Tax=Bacillus subtilis TaxID=1423 RepID=I2D9Y4_BACIU|nr:MULTISPECIES: competence pheromone ComX [Bacillus]AFJ78949.1 pheromone precursor [Bacillus subtilis]AFJ78991.1 pheromone precursor [Bacillus subtilis]AFJ78993.1 pheromone precursor [Bacillus subtilis]AFJ79005.1 pheromone precursor [Bacillus subtilis]AII38130.1 quorum-sensing pheromone [Bacillus subtilis TO-A]